MGPRDPAVALAAGDQRDDGMASGRVPGFFHRRMAHLSRLLHRYPGGSPVDMGVGRPRSGQVFRAVSFPFAGVPIRSPGSRARTLGVAGTQPAGRTVGPRFAPVADAPGQHRAVRRG